MEPFLPHDVIYRPKSGSGHHCAAGCATSCGRSWRTSVAGQPDSPGLFEPAAVQRLKQLNESGVVDGAYTLLSILSVEVWCRRFLDTAPDPGFIESNCAHT